MVVPPNGGPSTSASTSGATGSPAPVPPPVLRAKTSTAAAYNGNHLPLSMRRAEKLDMNTVERRGKPLSGSREPPTRTHINNLPEAATFRPTAEEWKDPMEYMRKISEEGRKYGIVKLIPPDTWNPDFAIDTEVSSPARPTVPIFGIGHNHKSVEMWFDQGIHLLTSHTAFPFSNAKAGTQLRRRRCANADFSVVEMPSLICNRHARQCRLSRSTDQIPQLARDEIEPLS